MSSDQAPLTSRLGIGEAAVASSIRERTQGGRVPRGQLHATPVFGLAGGTHSVSPSRRISTLRQELLEAVFVDFILMTHQSICRCDPP